MSRQKFVPHLLISFVCLGVISSGCGTGQRGEQAEIEVAPSEDPSAESSQTLEVVEAPESMDDMKLMVKASIDHHKMHGKGPSDWDSFISWAEANDPECVGALQSLRKAGVVFFCEQEAMKATMGQSNSIFAYYPSVPEKGGVVALMIGSVREMSAEDFGKMLGLQQQRDPVNVAKKSN